MQTLDNIIMQTLYNIIIQTLDNINIIIIHSIYKCSYFITALSIKSITTVSYSEKRNNLRNLMESNKFHF